MQCDIIAVDFRFGLDAGFDATGFDMVLPSALVDRDHEIAWGGLDVLRCSTFSEDKGRNEKGRL